ncbi:MAG: hypothetical protein M3512_08495 [Bacteroidota bacterium]|nr:hypothetical protein [Bacteroidota bacterium]
MKIFIGLFLLFINFQAYSQGKVPSPELQIRTAILAAPKAKREGATVYGYNNKKEVILLRKGNNEMICLADDPEKEGFNASCFHRDLETFMLRGWALQKEGKSFQEVFDIREKEVKEGKLKMPSAPSTLFVYSATEKNYSPQTGEITSGNFRYVVYIPYATSENTGLPLAPEAPGMPWIMDPGTHRAHIMINPPAKE